MRRALADRIAKAYVATGAEAVLLGGSTARGEADRHSDIELGVFWRSAPSDDERAAAITAAGGDLHRLWPYADVDRAWFDDWFIGRRADEPKSGVLVEAVLMTIDDAATVIEEVTESSTRRSRNRCCSPRSTTAFPWRVVELLKPWRDAARVYPDELARAVVERHAQIEHSWRFAMYRERDNPMRIAEAIVDVHQRVLHALLAVNRVYWYGFKSLESVTRRLPLAPEAPRPRLRRAYTAEPEELEPLLSDLVEETYDLVEAHVPARTSSGCAPLSLPPAALGRRAARPPLANEGAASGGNERSARSGARRVVRLRASSTHRRAHSTRVPSSET